MRDGGLLAMFDRFQRASVADPHVINSAVLDALRPDEKGLLSYRGTETRSYCPADRRVFQADRQSYLSTLAVTNVGSLRVAGITDRRGTICVTGQPGLAAYCLCLVKRGSAGVRMKGVGDTEAANPNQGVIYAAGAGTSFTSSDDNERLSLWIPAAKLRGCLETLIERPVTGDITFSPAIDLTRGTGASLRGLLGHLEAELSCADSLLSNHIATDLFENLLLRSIILGLAHNHSERLEGPRASADLKSVRRAEAYFHGNLTEVVTLRDLAREAGCSVRSLQLAFQQVRGVTPMAALRRARLDAARQLLERADRDASVTDVALQFGFSNLGRFARLYQRTFGERPLRTLREHR